MGSRFGGFRLDCGEMSAQAPTRGSDTPGWVAASSLSNRKVRIDPPKLMGKRFAGSDRYVSEPGAGVYTRYEARTYEPVPAGALPCPLWSFGAAGELQWR
jgi:hypothetical protein